MSSERIGKKKGILSSTKEQMKGPRVARTLRTANMKRPETMEKQKKELANATNQDQKTRINELISKLGHLPLGQGHEAYCAEQELIEIGKEAIPSLIEALKNGEWQVRSRAARALGEIGGLLAVPTLLDIICRNPAGIKTKEEWAVWDSASSTLRKITNGK
ncbi:hypothetical protein KKE38_02290 [Candidatus Micrarchaeota archaeon]|nr:hypothetical protein [Candidatus Micrarchaeota archaeon]MBU1681624.1 hypothetical protein [Candidatus Micrarchaeota archaeon]